MRIRWIALCLILVSLVAVSCSSSPTGEALPPATALDGGAQAAEEVDTTALLAQAQTALDAGDPNLAITYLQRVVAADGALAEAHFMLGNAYADKGMFSEAEAEFLRTLELDANQIDARANLGVVYYNQQRFPEAEETFRAALETEPDDAEIHYNLGGVLAAANRLDEAVTEFELAIDLAPDLAEPYLGLGSVYHLQGKREPAIEALKKYVSLSDDATWVARAEQILQELGETP